MKKAAAHSPEAINEVLKLLSNKWKVFVIRDLLEGKKRFGELKKMTGACSGAAENATVKKTNVFANTG